MAFRDRLLALLSFSLIAGAAGSAASLDGIYALAKRRVPTHVHSFSFSLSSGEPDSFVISDVPQGIHIDCTTVSVCARGFYT
ncbi:hypothetical protein LXA43DRAFT_709161 [Ganoderma leucocontextum]|nr:hypothetical protein LXA43DRAFT_709161 [Ganoderma leucocontextum]